MGEGLGQNNSRSGGLDEPNEHESEYPNFGMSLVNCWNNVYVHVICMGQLQMDKSLAKP